RKPPLRIFPLRIDDLGRPVVAHFGAPVRELTLRSELIELGRRVSAGSTHCGLHLRVSGREQRTAQIPTTVDNVLGDQRAHDVEKGVDVLELGYEDPLEA